MVRIPNWLFTLLLPVIFFGGCVSSVPPVWSWVERGRIREVQETDKARFPVLIRRADGIYSTAALGSIPTGSVLVTSGLDDSAINRDLNARINLNTNYKHFKVLGRTADITHVTLEVPTMQDSKFQCWYDIRGGEVIPQKIVSYGPGFAFLVIPPTTLCGLALATIFAVFVRPKKNIRNEIPKTKMPAREDSMHLL